jgi:transcriptional regulator of acetoin/glycerol metabolism
LKIRRLVDLEREELQKALTRAKGNTADAARLLGVSRKTVYGMMRRHGIGTIREYKPRKTVVS